MSAYVILEDQFIERAERLLNSQTLREDVHTVFLLVDHFLDATHLPLKYLGPVQRPLFYVTHHTFTIYPLGVSYKHHFSSSGDHEAELKGELFLQNIEDSLSRLFVIKIMISFEPNQRNAGIYSLKACFAQHFILLGIQNAQSSNPCQHVI